MKTLIATLLATAAGASFAAAPTAALNHDAATYNNVRQKADAAYQAVAAKCPAMSGNDKNVCMAEARLARVRAETDALSQYYNTPQRRQNARAVVANAEYDVAKAKCDASSGAEKEDCLNNAKSVHTAALADTKPATAANSSTGASAAGSLVSGTDTRDPVKASAVDKCAQAGGDAKTGCVIETKPSAVREGAAQAASRTETAADNAADQTRAAASTAASKTRDAAATAAEKTKAVAATAAEKTREVAQTAVEKTKQATSNVAQKTDNATADAGAKTRVVAADTAITAKVKAGLVKEPKLESLGIHVETVQGVVMLSGFVNSKDEADRALQVAKNVDGVNNVRSAIQVK